jgi:hypothetical protein
MPSGTTLTGYSVQQSVTSGPWTDVANCSKTSTTTNCAALSLPAVSANANVTYSFRVAAITKTGTVSSTGPYATATAVVGTTTSTSITGGQITASTACALYAVGPAGGTIVYSGAGFACGPTKSSTCTTIEVGPNLGSMAWCSKLNMVTGAVDTAVGTGASNTAAMLAIGCTSGAGFTANAYRGGGFSDWHLPSQLEAAIFYSTLYQRRQTSTDTRNTSWTSTTWWTSTQVSNFNSTARTSNIATAVSSELGKASSAEVHPIRTF